VTITKPLRVPLSYIKLLVHRKSAWIEAKISELSKRPKRLLAHHSNKDYLENKEAALELAIKKVNYFNQFYKYDIGKISIKNQSTRWGSCSGKKNLNFNYKILFLPENLQDYLVVHELCHLAQMNHSARFWGLVATYIPDYKTLRNQLKLY
jgi:predicted metal-dependent hydrolase